MKFWSFEATNFVDIDIKHDMPNRKYMSTNACILPKHYVYKVPSSFYNSIIATTITIRAP